MTRHAAPVPPDLAPSRHVGAEPRRTWLVVTVWAVTSSVAALGLLAVQPVTGLSMEILSLVMLAPAIGAVICRAALRKHLPSFAEPAPAGRFLLAVVLSVVVAAVYFAAVSIARSHPPQVPARVAGMPVAVMILAQAVGALAEEIGFRGILFHALSAKTPRFVAATVVGLLFGVWHVQYFELPLLEHLAFILGTVALTVTMTSVMTGSFWQRMVVCTIIHLGANLALAFTGGDAVPMSTFGLALLFGCLIVGPIGAASARRAQATEASGSGRRS
ncbi:CPBP family intramembrane metalloprotease [Nonomuraea phyllanthi]|uniref:CPBP family intramembrane metalloprotease n=1 Tax=Nonomuraea phyllanthi TaxID=2219224 RepID=A0A5C4W551_9ACTN|nr:CPBP family intramembrane glutamic endopeptidase [Nonomuraea phyllanthi]KAB8192017.1 CPBP family intramembrane metalloprotease [Nonomuraea phyllanthi]QFY09901.1 CPBP family intramembrane metalloprotease [Nonomuraea phyllanthi]